MGTDHDARKRSKKTRKGAFAIDKELASEGRRKRPKKRKVRKLCTGMCYQPPMVRCNLFGALYNRTDLSTLAPCLLSEDVCLHGPAFT